MAVLRRRLAPVAVLLTATPIFWCAPGTTLALANGSCSTVSWVNVSVTGTPQLSYTFYMSTSNRIIGADVHQNASWVMEGYLKHSYTSSGTTLYDTVNLTKAYSDNVTYSAWISVQYC